MHDDAERLTALGWTMFVLYLTAALLCFRAAAALVHSRPSAEGGWQSAVGSQRPAAIARVWSSLGFILAALGANKPLNLQTRLIELGRQVAGKEQLLAHRAGLYLVFFAGFALAGFGLFAVLALRCREPIGRFVRRFPLAAVGCVLVCAYIVIRAADIDHVDEMLGFDLENVTWLWLLEAGGLLLIIVQTLRIQDEKTRERKR